MRLCFGRTYDLEYIPPDEDEHWVNEFYLVDYDGKQISPKVYIRCYTPANEEEPWYSWKLPLYDWDKDKFYLNNIYDYLLERMNENNER